MPSEQTERDWRDFLEWEYGYSRICLGRDHDTTMRWLRTGFQHVGVFHVVEELERDLHRRSHRVALLRDWRPIPHREVPDGH